jgi:hypothetical protein
MYASFSTHLAGQFDNLPQRLNLYTNQLNLQQGLAQVNSFLPTLAAAIGKSLELCTGVGAFFNSIKGAGMDLLNQVGDAIGQIVEAISAAISGAVDTLMSVLNTVVKTIEQAAGAAIDMIAKEAEALGKALSDLLDFGGAASLLNIFNHPCAKTVLGAVGTAGLVGALRRCTSRPPFNTNCRVAG